MQGFSTNRVAERAGVSVGSLYQYFPNKESLLAEVARRLEMRAQTLVLERLQACRELPLRDVIEALVDVLLGDALSVRQVRHVLRRDVPSGWITDTSKEVDQEVRRAIAGELARRDDVRHDATPELLAWVASHAVELLVEQAVLLAPEMLERREFRDQLITLAYAYLRRE